MSYTKRPFNPKIPHTKHEVGELIKVNKNFEILANAFVSENPTTGIVKNTDKVDGFHASQIPAPNTIPVAKSDGKIDQNWLPDIGSNADTVDGFHASQTPGANTVPATLPQGYLPDGWIKNSTALTIYVDNVNGSDTTGDGSASSPFRTVNKALSLLPIKLNANVTIVLKKSPTSYGNIFIRGFVCDNGSLTIQGEFDILDSGTVSSFSNSVDDPQYSSLVQVAKITDNTKSWTTNQFQYKLIRVYKGATSYYRTICYNDSNSIYCNQTFPVTIDDTWSYEILDWGTRCNTITVDFNKGNVNIRNLKVQRDSNGFVVVPRRTDMIGIDNCYLIGYPNGSYPVIITYLSFLDVSNTIIDANNSTSYTIQNATSESAVCYLSGCVILNNSATGGVVFNDYHFSKFVLRNGTRIYKGASNPNTGIAMYSGSLVGYEVYGKVLIDAGTTGISLTRGAYLQFSSSFVFGPNVATPISAYWGMVDGAKLNVRDYFGVNITNHNPNNVHSRILCNGSFATRVHTITTNTTLGVDHHIVLVNASGGDRTITLPDATTCAGRQYIIKKIDDSSNAVIIQPQSGQTIDGQTSISITTQYDVKRIVSDGSNWYSF